MSEPRDQADAHGFTAAGGGRSERTHADLSTLLVELERLVRGRSFYASDESMQRDILDRAYRAFAGELLRAGPLELTIEATAIRASQVAESITGPHLRESMTLLRSREIERIELAEDLSPAGFQAFIELLEAPDDEIRELGGFGRALAAFGDGGVVINGERAAAPSEMTDASTPSRPAPSLGASLLGPSRRLVIDPEEPRTARQAARANPNASIAPPHREEPPAVAPGDETTETMAPPIDDLDLDIGEDVPSPESFQPPAPIETPEPMVTHAAIEDEPEPDEPLEKPALESNPLTAPADDPRGARLLERLIELDRCYDDDAYEFLSTRIVDWATDLFESGLASEWYRAVLVFADHTVGSGGRSGLQARLAQGYCRTMATDERLTYLISRACSANTAVSVRATQILLTLGEHTVPRLIDELAASQASGGSPQLAAILITLGESALPVIEQMIKGQAETRARLAIRMAGGLQNAALTSVLVEVIESDRRALRRDAVRALIHIGGVEAVDALIQGLTSHDEELRTLSALGLGAMADLRAVQPLLAAMDAALEQRNNKFARELIRALGQLGTRRAVPKLVALLESRSLIRRKQVRELKLAALMALDSMSGREACAAVQRARRSRDTVIRTRADHLVEAGVEPPPLVAALDPEDDV